MTQLSLFLSVCFATACTTGLFLLAGAFVIAREIRKFTQATEANSAAVDRFVAAKQEELRQVLAAIQSQKPPAGLYPLSSRKDDDGGPKGSA